MTTLTTPIATIAPLTSKDFEVLPSLPVTLETLQALRLEKGGNDARIHSLLDKAYKECLKHNTLLVLERIMIYIGDVSRQHNILRDLKITSPNGGAQERRAFRSIMRWWEKNMPESFQNNIPLIAEYTLYENLMFYQITTDRYKGNIQSVEILFPAHERVYDFLASQIRRGRDLKLIARHLPKAYVNEKGELYVSKNRTTIRKVKPKKGITEFNWKLPTNKSYVKIDGKIVTDEQFVVRDGTELRYPRTKQSETIKRQEYINKWIAGFCKYMNWGIEEYINFRKMQNSPEQIFSNKSVLNLTKTEFWKLFDTFTTLQRKRIARQIAYKDTTTKKLVAREKWGDLGKWYIQWEDNQAAIAKKINEAEASGNAEEAKKLEKSFKVKGTGTQTVDLLTDLFKNQQTETQVNNTYQAMLKTMDMVANVFVVIDGSTSMDNQFDEKINGISLSYRQIAYTMALTFITRNPNKEFRNTFGWFSNNFTICGNSKYKDLRPNKYLAPDTFRKQVPQYQVLSETKTFVENYHALYAADPKEYACTNMFSTIEFFVKMVEDNLITVEDLPLAILFLTDMENNTGRTPKEAVILANSIGWSPLMIFWNFKKKPTPAEFKGIPNVLFQSGFNESSISQILRQIKTGSINPETELWAIYDNPRYALIK